MAETTGITISQLPATTMLNPTDRFEVDREGGAYSITYDMLVSELKETLGLLELVDALTEIIG